MKLGDHDISYDEYRYFYLKFRDDHESRADTDYDDTMKKEIEDALKKKYAVSDYAAERGVALSSDDEKNIKEQKSQYIEYYGGKEGFESVLAEEHMNEKLFVELLKAQALEEKLRSFEYDEFTGSIRSDDATVEAYINDNFIHATQILIRNEENEDIIANKKLADEIHERAVNGEDFDSLILQYNEDSYMNGETVGYYFVEGQLIPAFEDAAQALELNEISDVIPSYLGWHIIKRLPLDKDYINDNFEELRTIYKSKMFNDNVSSMAASVPIAYTEYYDTLTPQMLINNIKKAD